MDRESATSGPLQQAASATVGTGSTRLTSTPVIPGMKMEFPGPPPGYGHGFGPPTILDLSPRGVDHPPSIQSPYTPGTYLVLFQKFFSKADDVSKWYNTLSRNTDGGLSKKQRKEPVCHPRIHTPVVKNAQQGQGSGLFFFMTNVHFTTKAYL